MAALATCKSKAPIDTALDRDMMNHKVGQSILHHFGDHAVYKAYKS
jgi:hypothetical protein